MASVLDRVLAKLRQDDNNPLHTLDRWLLTRVDEHPPGSIWDLMTSCEMRSAPFGRKPELDPGHIRRWLLEASSVGRGLVRSETKDADSPDVLDWSLTEAGKERRRRLAGVRTVAAGAPPADPPAPRPRGDPVPGV